MCTFNVISNFSIKDVASLSEGDLFKGKVIKREFT